MLTMASSVNHGAQASTLKESPAAWNCDEAEVSVNIIVQFMRLIFEE